MNSYVGMHFYAPMHFLWIYWLSMNFHARIYRYICASMHLYIPIHYWPSMNVLRISELLCSNALLTNLSTFMHQFHALLCNDTLLCTYLLLITCIDVFHMYRSIFKYFHASKACLKTLYAPMYFYALIQSNAPTYFYAPTHFRKSINFHALMYVILCINALLRTQSLSIVH